MKYYDGYQGRWVEANDLRVDRLDKPWLAEVLEPLSTKVPNPCLTAPFCCYINTVIFYARPRRIRPWHRIWHDGRKLRAQEPGTGFEEWARVETRLHVDDLVDVDGEEFVVGCGRVIWRGKGRGWWMRHPLRRRRVEGAAAA